MGKNTARKIIDELMKLRQPLNTKCKKDVKDGVPIVCSRADEEYCSIYAFPTKKWKNGDCPMADETLRTVIEEEPTTKVRVGQQKGRKKKK